MDLQRIKNLFVRGFYKVRKKTKIYGKLDYAKYPLFVYGGIRWFSCSKEPETVEWIENFRKDDIVYDVGSNIGAYSLIMSKYAKQVYAFEPAIFNFNILTKNILYNYSKGFIENNITPLNIALSSKKSMNDFNYNSMVDGSASHVYGRNINAEGKAFRPVFSHKLLSVSIDDFITDFKAPVPNSIKIDVDGNELSILEGASETLKDKKLRSLLVEINQELKEGQTSIKLIEENGFVKSKVKTKNPRIFNYIFNRPEDAG